jgi:uncharacterized protein YjbI with pentapeptide repeats
MTFRTISSVLFVSAFLSSDAEEVTVKAEKAVVITFPSQDSRTYKILGAENAEGPWRSLQDGIAGTGGEITVFYKSQSDQKLFFKVEGAEGSPAPLTLLSPTDQALLAGARLNLTGRDFAGFNLQGRDLMQFIFRGANLRGANLSRADLREAELSEAILDGANLAGANLIAASANNASFQGADLRGIVMHGHTSFQGAKFNGANMEGTRFWAGMSATDFRNAKLNGAFFIQCPFLNANLSGQSFSNVSFYYCNFTGADLSGANFAGGDFSRDDFTQTKLDGANLTNAKFEGSTFQGVPLTGRDLRGSILRGVVVLSDDWSGINAAGVDASLAKFAIAAGANFAGANLEGAVLAAGSHAGANFRNAKLHAADLSGANLENADFTGADLSFAVVAGANLSGATGFDPAQPGMDFGNGAVLPDGITRAGKNPGTGLAPASVPARLRFDINDVSAVATREMTFGANGYSEPGKTGSGFRYIARGAIATLGLPFENFPSIVEDNYTLLFTSPAGGKLFKNAHRTPPYFPYLGLYQIGTFTVVQ